MTWTELHPALNALLNLSAFALLIAAFRAVRRRDLARHRRLMLAAASVSTLFLVSYVIRFALTGAHRYPGSGWDRSFYLVLLASHTLLATVCLPMVLRTLWLGLKGLPERHRRIARLTFPIWVYVSATGVLVYLMLYHLSERL